MYIKRVNEITKKTYLYYISLVEPLSVYVNPLEKLKESII